MDEIEHNHTDLSDTWDIVIHMTDNCHVLADIHSKDEEWLSSLRKRKVQENKGLILLSIDGKTIDYPYSY